MTKKIKCETKTDLPVKTVRVRIIKAPLVNTEELRNIIFARERALVL